MYLPNADRAVIEERKITEYLLSLTHPDGESKARYFRGFGFRSDEWERFADALRNVGQNNRVTEARETSYGIQYVIIGQMNTPDGRRPFVRTVWQIDHGTDSPRLITARRQRFR